MALCSIPKRGCVGGRGGWLLLLPLALRPASSVKLTAKKDLSFGSFTFVIGGLCSALFCSAQFWLRLWLWLWLWHRFSFCFCFCFCSVSLLAAAFTVGPSAKTIRIRSAAALSSSSSSFASANVTQHFWRAVVKSCYRVSQSSNC